MALALYDRVQQTGTANTTVSFTLSGSVTGYQSFSVVGNGNTSYYGATDTSGNWEVGIGTYATGGTLTRTTILSSSNSGSAVTFSGTVTVFVTYPSGKSVNLDGSGNVSALGTIASGTWNGLTIGVAYGGTGVTASSGASSVMLRDSNQNVSINRLNQSTTTVTAAAGTTTLTVASTFSWVLTGTGGQTFRLPDATTLTNTTAFEFNNNATGTLTIVDNASGAVGTIAPGGAAAIALLSNGTVAGTWDVHAYIPENVQWGTNSLALGSTVISGGTWQGGTIASGYGGTGLTTFTAANNALYSTSSSALAAGTLPIAAGGTGQITATAAFDALDPMTTTGDMIYEASAGVAARLPIGTSGQVLTVSGGIPAWSAAPGSSTLNIQDFTATSGQTSFTVTYTVGLVEGVYRNGIKLGTSDYAATSGTAIVLGTGAITGDLIQVVYFTAVAVTNVVNTITAGTGISVSGSTGNVTISSTVTGPTVTGTTTAGTYYVVGTTSTSGALTTASISNTNAVSYNASTGALTAVSMVSSSDERLKSNIQTITNAVQTVESLRGVSYLRNDRLEIGVVAQEIEKVLPMLVHEDPEGYKSVAYGNMVGLLIEAVKELSAEVKALKAELNK